MHSKTVFSCWLLVNIGIAAGQDAGSVPRIPGVQLDGSLRARLEHWQWFSAPPAQSSYAYGTTNLRLRLSGSSGRFQWQVEGGFPLLLNLPANAVAEEPAGPLGYGGDYFLVNGKRNLAAAVLRQAFVGMKSARMQFKLGRLEFADGAEAVPPDPQLAELKRDRINQRLISTFNYALRSLDGAQFTYQSGQSDITLMAARLVEGSFLLRAFREIDVELAYGSYTRYFSSADTRREVRFFGLGYRDGRGVLKIDNRSKMLLEADRRPILLATPGAHFISEQRAGFGTVDVLVWAAGQFGRWGSQQHLAAEMALEAGYRFPGKIQPWLRLGYFRSTGDPDPEDGHHQSFFQVLSSPRAYARFPFQVLMNVENVFVHLKARPSPKWVVRSEMVSARLSNARDLWYDGGGAFEAGTFGYLGRPSGGRRNIGTSFDLSADCALSGTTTIALYAGAAVGNAVPAYVFPNGERRRVHVVSIELIRRF